MQIVVLAAHPLALSGYVTSVAKTVFDVVTLPVKVVSEGVDLATTSQSEADQKCGRDLRRAEEEEAGRVARALEQECAAVVRRGDACAALDPLAPRAA